VCVRRANAAAVPRCVSPGSGERTYRRATVTDIFGSEGGASVCHPRHGLARPNPSSQRTSAIRKTTGNPEQEASELFTLHFARFPFEGCAIPAGDHEHRFSIGLDHGNLHQLGYILHDRDNGVAPRGGPIACSDWRYRLRRWASKAPTTLSFGRQRSRGIRNRMI